MTTNETITFETTDGLEVTVIRAIFKSATVSQSRDRGRWAVSIPVDADFHRKLKAARDRVATNPKATFCFGDSAAVPCQTIVGALNRIVVAVDQAVGAA